MTSVTCAGCCTNFKTQQALATHIQWQQDCKNFYQSVASIKNTETSMTNKLTTFNENNIIVNDDLTRIHLQQQQDCTNFYKLLCNLNKEVNKFK